MELGGVEVIVEVGQVPEVQVLPVTGIPGRDGVDGAPGRDGLDGAPGRDGVDGAPGQDGADGTPGADGAPGDKGDKGDPGQPAPRKPGSILDELPLTDFWIPHHGGGTWPGLTYTPSVLRTARLNIARGARLIDMDLRRTKDNVLVEFHDPTTAEFGTYNVAIASAAYGQLPQIDARKYLGPGTPLVPLSTADEWFEELVGTVCISCELKGGITDLPDFIKLMDRHNAYDSVLVAVSPAGTVLRDALKAAGIEFQVYGLTSVAQINDAIDNGARIIGLPIDSSEDMKNAAARIVTANNGRVIAESGAGAASLGVSTLTELATVKADPRFNGYASDAPGYLESPKQPIANDIEMAKLARVNGLGWVVKPNGTLPDPINWLDTTKGILMNDGAVLNFVHLRDLAGSRGGGTWTATFEVLMETLPTTTQFVGVRFCLPIVNIASGAGGAFPCYNVRLRSDGRLQMDRVNLDGTTTSLGAINSTALVAGTPVQVRFEVTPTTVRASRVDTGATTPLVTDATHPRDGGILTYTNCNTGKTWLKSVNLTPAV